MQLNAEEARDAFRDLAGRLSELGRRLVEELHLTVDRDRWSQAATWRERMAAVSWPRAAIFGGVPLALILGLALALQPDRGPRPPHLPTPDEIAAGESAAAAFAAGRAATGPQSGASQ